MSPALIAKIALALAGLLCFLLGVRTGLDVLRWSGIALVAVAWLLRFIPERNVKHRSTTSPSEEA